MRNLITSYFDRNKTKFFGNKTAIYRRTRSSYVFSLSNSPFFVSFHHFFRPIRYARARREHGFDAGGSAKPEPQQRRH